ALQVLNTCSAAETLEPSQAIRIDIPTPYSRLSPRVIGGNGQIVGGDYVTPEGKGRAFVWQRDGRIVLLENPGSTRGIYVKGASPNGGVIVGNRWVGSSSIAYRWTAETGIVDITPPTPSAIAIPFCVSDDGRVIAGRSSLNGSQKRWGWTPDTGVVDLPAPSGSSGGVVYDMTPDGSVLVGCSFGGPATFVPVRWNLPEAANGLARWSTATAQVKALELPPVSISCAAYAVSDDGSVIVGTTGSSFGAAIWRSDGSGRFFGGPTYGARLNTAIAVTGYGKQIAGSYVDDMASTIGTKLWSEESGLVSDYLRGLGLPVLGGPFIAMSSDGHSMLFEGYSSGGWLVVGVPRIDGPRCGSDFNADRFVDDTDFATFALAYNTSDCDNPAMPAGCPADFDRDRLVTDADFQIFAAQYDGVFCPQ
ncbi:MAG: hypothetical protein ACK58T_26430, partial [Phycisphaerae bacterium]